MHSVPSGSASNSSVEVLGTFASDGGPAVTRRMVGSGFAVYAGFFPGLSCPFAFKSRFLAIDLTVTR